MSKTLAGVATALEAKRAEQHAAHEAYLTLEGDESDRAYVERHNALVAKAEKIDAECDALVRQASDLIVAGGDEPFSGGGLRLGFNQHDLRAAFEDVRARRAVSFGGGLPIGAVVDSTALPMGAVPDYRISEVFPMLREVPVVAALFPSESTDADTVAPYRGKTKASAAAPVAKGGTKPTSSPEWEKVEYPLEVIAHLAVIDNRIVSDYSAWRDFVGQEMVAGLLEQLDAQVIDGSGSTPALAGLIGTANLSLINNIDRDGTNNEPVSKALHRGMTAVRKTAYVDPTHIIIHPDDLETVRFERASVYNGSGVSELGEFLNGEPTDGEIKSLWGLTVVPTTAIDSGDAIVLNPRVAGRLYVRQMPLVEVNPYESTAWSKNELSLRCETRVAFALVRPTAVCKVLIS